MVPEGICVSWSLEEVELGWVQEGHNLCMVGFFDKTPPGFGASGSWWSTKSHTFIIELGSLFLL